MRISTANASGVLIRTLTHKKQKMWPQGRRAGCMQVWRQMGHSRSAVVGVPTAAAAAAVGAGAGSWLGEPSVAVNKSFSITYRIVYNNSSKLDSISSYLLSCWKFSVNHLRQRLPQPLRWTGRRRDQLTLWVDAQCPQIVYLPHRRRCLRDSQWDAYCWYWGRSYCCCCCCYRCRLLHAVATCYFFQVLHTTKTHTQPT